MAQTLCQNYSRQELFQRSLAVTALAFRAADVWSVSESGTENILESDPSAESSRPP